MQADENARLQYVVATKGKLFLHSSAIVHTTKSTKFMLIFLFLFLFSVQTSSEADEVRLTTAYSELFRIVLNDKHAQDRDNYRGI